MEPTTPAPSSRGDVLLVDDTPENLGLLSAILKGRGYRVRAVPSGPLALQAARAEAPELVLLDINMPVMDGFEVCRRFKADPALRAIPIIFLSALSDTADKVLAFTVGGVDYVTKPFKAEEITARVETHLSMRRLQRELEASHQALLASHRKLEALEQARQGLVQMVVHDLKNPIATIQLCAGLLRREEGMPESAQPTLDDVEGMARLMTRMVMDVLDVARTEQVQLLPRFAAVELRDLFTEVENELRGMVRCSRRQLTFTLAPGTPAPVRADRDLLRRVLSNLIDNALKYAPRQSDVRVEVAPAEEGWYRLTVSDQGRGIPEAMRQRIFEPFARLDQEVDEHARTSRGLGLAFCRLAVEAHGGRISVEDNVPQGSRFVMALPVRAEAPVTAPAPLAAPAAT